MHRIKKILPEIFVLAAVVAFILTLAVIRFKTGADPIEVETSSGTVQSGSGLTKADKIILGRLIDLPIEKLMVAMRMPEIWEMPT